MAHRAERLIKVLIYGLAIGLGSSTVIASAEQSADEAATARVAPSVAPVDAPELAHLGRYRVGVIERQFVQANQLIPSRDGSSPSRSDRRLRTLIWYPSDAAGSGIVYRAGMAGEDNADVEFTVPGIATRDAAIATGKFPVIVLAHGFGNAPEALSWLGENLASKGYVVLAPAFSDPPINIRTAASGAVTLARRPLDIAFLVDEIRKGSAASDAILSSVDPDNLALIGYSAGGYGAISAAGAPLSPGLSERSQGALAPYVAGGDEQGRFPVPGLRAVVAIAPANDARSPNSTWSDPGIAAVSVPTFFIAGEQDHVVGYDPGVRTLFEQQMNAPRFLLTFREAGHSIALIGAPPEMRRTYWDSDWFEDAVWRKKRMLPIQAHFITAFLDRFLKSDPEMDSYLFPQVENSNDGEWPSAPGGRYAGYSPGLPTSTIWKGFQRGRAGGMRLEFRPGG